MSTWWSDPAGPGHAGPDGAGPGRAGARFARTMSAATDLGIGYAEAAGAAVWGGVRGAGSMARRVWVEDRPRRQYLRARRRRQWWDRGGEWRLLVALEVVGVAALVTGRTAWRITRATPGGAWAGAGQGWQDARTRRAGNYPGTGHSGSAWTAGPRPEPGPDPVVEVTVEDLPRSPRPAPAAPGPAGPVQTEVIVDADVVDQDGRPAGTDRAGTDSAWTRGPAWTPEVLLEMADLEATADESPSTSVGEQIRCVLCEQTPCVCPPMGSPESRSPEFLALIQRRHAQARAAEAVRPAALSEMHVGNWARLPDGSMGQISAVTSDAVRVRTPQGERWLEPVADALQDTGAGQSVAQLPDAGPTTQPSNTTQEDPLMSMPALASAAASGSVSTSLGGELTGPADLLAETSHVQSLAERAAAVKDQLESWAAGLPDLVTGAPWGTGAVASAADGIAQAQGTDNLRETITGLHGALDQADELGESLGSIGATGSVDALAGGQ